MPNNIKESGTDDVELQITKPARAAELVKGDSDGDPTYRAAFRVYAFDDVLLVGVHVAGHGYKVHLPVARQRVRHGNSDWTTLTDSIHTTVPVGSSIAISSRHSPRNGSERPRTGSYYAKTMCLTSVMR